MKGQVAIPETSEGLEELLNDDGRITEILAAGQFGEFQHHVVVQRSRRAHAACAGRGSNSSHV